MKYFDFENNQFLNNIIINSNVFFSKTLQSNEFECLAKLQINESFSSTNISDCSQIGRIVETIDENNFGKCFTYFQINERNNNNQKYYMKNDDYISIKVNRTKFTDLINSYIEAIIYSEMHINY